MNKYKNKTNTKAFFIIIFISLICLTGITALVYSGSQPAHDYKLVASLPLLNAFFNGLATLAIIIGIWSIKNKKILWHASAMITALFSSALFLVGYLVYHYYLGDTIYVGTYRSFYLLILISHLVMSFISLPLVLSSFYLAFAKNFKLHAKVSKITFPCWIYVSITGILIYLLLKYTNYS